MQTTLNRVNKHRDALRASGLRPLQIWVPDVRRAGFADECKRQALAVAKADTEDTEMMGFLDAALEDVEGWAE